MWFFIKYGYVRARFTLTAAETSKTVDQSQSGFKNAYEACLFAAKWIKEGEDMVAAYREQNKTLSVRVDLIDKFPATHARLSDLVKYFL